MIYHSFEKERCLDFLQSSEDERHFEDWIADRDSSFGLIIAEGFEERSLGLLKKIAKTGIKLSGIIIGRYIGDIELNKKYRSQFEKFAEAVAPGRWKAVKNNNDGLWINEAIKSLDSDTILFDITSMSNRGLFGGLDAAISSGQQIYIGYSEAEEYWPKKTDWQKLKVELAATESLTEVIDKKPWLFSYEHRVELVPDHEGYDSAGCQRALIGFLPFKCARLGAILNQEDFSECLFIAGCPRLEENVWRLEALKKINEPIIANWPIKEIGTFGYRNSFKELVDILLSEDSLLQKFDVHLAILGSKLQTVACWTLSCILRSITVTTSIPAKYYPEAFSDGIGASWAFKLPSPYK